MKIVALIFPIIATIWLLVQIFSTWKVERFADCLASELLADRPVTQLVASFAEQHANQASSDQGVIDAESSRIDPEMYWARRKGSADLVRTRVIKAVTQVKRNAMQWACTRETMRGEILKTLFESEVPRLVVESGQALGKTRAEIASRLDPLWSVRFFR